MSTVATRWFALKRAAALIRGQPGGFLLNVALVAVALAVPLFMAVIAYTMAPSVTRIQAGPELNVFVALGTSPERCRADATEADRRRRRCRRAPDRAGSGLCRTEPPLRTRTRRGTARESAAGRTGGPFRGDDRPGTRLSVWPLLSEPGRESTRSGWTSNGFDAPQRLRGRQVMVLAVVAGLTLVLIALVLVAAVRVQAESRRDETAVLQLAGAPTSFIVRPYAYAGALTLGLGAALRAGHRRRRCVDRRAPHRCTCGHLWAGLPHGNAAGLAALRDRLAWRSSLDSWQRPSAPEHRSPRHHRKVSKCSLVI